MPCNDCSIKCKERYTSWYSKRKDFDCMPIGHVLPRNYLIENDIISLEKNDELLLNYIIKNCSNLEEVCYFDITMDIISGLGKLMHSQNDMIKYLIDYLYLSFGDPNSEDNIIKDEYFKRRFSKIKKDSKYKKGVVNVRTGQQELKKQLLYLYGECCICGLENSKLLVASHIKPLKDCLLEESYDISNSLLLCRTHDGLFDSGLISFDDDGKVIISEKLSTKDREIIHIEDSIKINTKGIDTKYLKWHRENVFNE